MSWNYWDWQDFWMKTVLGVILLFFVLILWAAWTDTFKVQPAIAQKWSGQYESGDVSVFLDAIDADWHDFDKSPTLRKTYENVRDGRESLGEIKKKKNETTYIPVIIPVSS